MTVDTATQAEELRGEIRRYLASTTVTAEAAIRRRSEGLDRAEWRRLADQLGIQGVFLAEANGGAGLGLAELLVVQEELGRILFAGPYLSTVVLGATAIEAVGDRGAMERHLAAIASGTRTAAVVMPPMRGAADHLSYPIQAKPEGSGAVLDGALDHVIDGDVADLLLVFGRTPEGVVLFEVPVPSEGLVITPMPGVDLHRRLARVELAGVRARALGDSAQSRNALHAALTAGHLALAAESLGGAARCLEMAVDYAKSRVQFGSVIGSFQAVKHRCVEMLVQLELSRSALALARRMSAEGELDKAAAAAKAICCEAFFKVAAENVQIHGGIGFTWEHPAHLYFRRAKSNELLMGHPSEHRRELATLLGV